MENLDEYAINHPDVSAYHPDYEHSPNVMASSANVVDHTLAGHPDYFPSDPSYLPSQPQYPPPNTTSNTQSPQHNMPTAPINNVNRSARSESKLTGFFDKVAQSFSIAKQFVMEKSGKTEASFDPVTKRYIEQLKEISEFFDKLETVVVQMCANFAAFTNSQKVFGELCYEAGVKEKELIGGGMRDVGLLHRNLNRPNEEMLSSLTRFKESVVTFRKMAIGDTLDSLKKYEGLRFSYDASRNRLADSTLVVDEDAQKVHTEENRVKMEKYGTDLQEKVSILNQKRLYDMKVLLDEHVNALRQYHISCNEEFLQNEIDIPSVSTSEFSDLMGGNSRYQ